MGLWWLYGCGFVLAVICGGYGLWIVLAVNCCGSVAMGLGVGRRQCGLWLRGYGFGCGSAPVWVVAPWLWVWVWVGTGVGCGGLPAWCGWGGVENF
jgi:hypothetical protein